MGKSNYNPERHHRKSIRLQRYDYSQAGLYFITICIENRECLFGEIVENKMVANEFGAIVLEEWKAASSNYVNVEMDAFVVMPNHVHGIIWIKETVGAIHESPLHESPLHESPIQTPPYRDERRKMLLSKIVGKFKMVSAKRINLVRKTEGGRVWQRNFYEHIIRNEKSFLTILEYIETNPAKWSEDKFYEQIKRAGKS